MNVNGIAIILSSAKGIFDYLEKYVRPNGLPQS